MTKILRTIALIAIPVILVAVLVLFSPWFKQYRNSASNNAGTNVSETIGNTENTGNSDVETTTPETEVPETTAPSTETEAPETTDPTEDTTGTDTEITESEEVKTNSPVYADVEAYILAIIDNQYKGVNIAPEKAIVYDVRPDQFVSAEIPAEIEVLMMITGDGRMTIVQEGYEFNELIANDQKSDVVVRACTCKEHKASWDSEMGPFHYHVVEGNEALAAKYFSRNEGTLAKVKFNKEALAELIAAGQYWYNGDTAVTGLRICGKLYEAPKPVVPEEKPVETKSFTLKYAFKAANGANLPEGVMKQLPASASYKDGTKVTAPTNFTAVRDGNGTWKFQSWDKATVTVKENVTVVGTWVYTKDAPVLKDFTLNFQMVSDSNRNLPSKIIEMTPPSMTVKEGTQKSFSELAGKVVDVPGGKWICTGYDPKSVTVKGNMTIKIHWTFEADTVIVIPSEPEYHTVSINYVTYDGSPIPQNVLNGLKKAETVKEGGKFSLNMNGFSYINAEGKTYEFHAISRNDFVVAGDTEVTVYFIKALELSTNYPDDNTPEHTEEEDGTNGEHTTPSEPKDDNPLDDDRTTHPEEEEKKEESKKEEIPEEEYNHPVADEDTQKELDDIFGDRTDEVETNKPVHTGLGFATPVVDEVEEEAEAEVENTLGFADTVTDTESTEGVHSAVVTENSDAANVDNEENALSFATPVESEESEEETKSLSLMVTEEATAETEESVETGLGLSLAPAVDDSEVADQDTQNELDALFGGRE